MTKAVLSSAIAALFSVAIFAQEADTARFEAADVHVSAPSSNIRNNFIQGPFVGGGRFEIRRATIIDLVRLGWQVQPDKIVGGPAWVSQDRFEILAKAPTAASSADLRTMLQNLLAERLGLKVHKDTKPMPAFALVAPQSKKTHLKESDGNGEPGCKPQNSNGLPPAGGGRLMMGGPNGVVTINLSADNMITYNCRHVTMDAFAAAMQNIIGTTVGPNPVSNETKLDGAWDFDLKFTLGLNGPMMANAGTERITFADAVEKQLGLKLEKRDVPMAVTVIDSVNQTPTPNPPDMKLNLPPLPTEFEVAAIKPTPPDFQFGNFQPQRGGRVNMQSLTLSNLIRQAWGIIGADQIAGLPKFASTDRWDIVAEAPTYGPDPDAGSKSEPVEGVRFQTIDQDSINVMLRNLLIERFQIKYHMEDRPTTAFVMTTLKSKLKKADPADTSGCKAGPGKDGKDPRIANPAASRLVSCVNTTMKQFAEYIAGSAGGYIGGSMIYDETGLECAFEFTLNFSLAGAGTMRGSGGDGAMTAASEPTNTITLSEAFEKQLGLKLEQTKRTAPVMVIDHIEQKPIEN